jgi:hypothetical protein
VTGKAGVTGMNSKTLEIKTNSRGLIFSWLWRVVSSRTLRRVIWQRSLSTILRSRAPCLLLAWLIIRSWRRTPFVPLKLLPTTRCNFPENDDNELTHEPYVSPEDADHDIYRKLFCRRPVLLIHYIYLWLYSALLDLGRFFSFLIFYTVSTTPWTGDQPVVRPLPAHRTAHKHRINTHRHPCLEWDSNPWSQCSSGRRQFMR